MKSRKDLKKQIRKTFNTLYQDVFFYETFTIKADTVRAKAIVEEMILAESELVKRISTTEGKYVKGRVKKYFTKLENDFQQKIAEFEDQINGLTH